jgi:hypothetical protein
MFEASGIWRSLGNQYYIVIHYERLVILFGGAAFLGALVGYLAARRGFGLRLRWHLGAGLILLSLMLGIVTAIALTLGRCDAGAACFAQIEPLFLAAHALVAALSFTLGHAAATGYRPRKDTPKNK